MNLIEGLQEEIKRVNEIVKVYDELPTGVFASSMMRFAIINAEKAIANSDTVKMIQSLKSLQQFKS